MKWFQNCRNNYPAPSDFKVIREKVSTRNVADVIFDLGWLQYRYNINIICAASILSSNSFWETPFICFPLFPLDETDGVQSLRDISPGKYFLKYIMFSDPWCPRTLPGPKCDSIIRKEKNYALWNDVKKMFLAILLFVRWMRCCKYTSCPGVTIMLVTRTENDQSDFDYISDEHWIIFLWHLRSPVVHSF